MKSKKEIEEKIKRIEDDERYNYPPANVDINDLSKRSSSEKDINYQS